MIKFKAYIEEENEIVNVSHIMWDKETGDILNIASKDLRLYNVALEDIYILQFTGEYDKYGYEIYTGDILENKWIVVYDKGSFILRKYNPMSTSFEELSFREAIMMDILPNLSIVGNVFQYPFLAHVENYKKIMCN